MNELFYWVYHPAYGYGVITERKSGRFKEETAIYFPYINFGHNGREQSKMRYNGKHLLFYTDDLYALRISEVENG